nr:TRAP transporter substrate-binding protein DctP [Spirochaetaceae bacterium]
MKKPIIVISVIPVLIVLAFTGCTKKVVADVKPIVLRLAETHPADYPTTQGDFEFAKLVEKRSNGKIKIKVYPGAQLGEEKAVIEQVQFGAIDFTRVSISPLSAFADNFDALQM